MSSSSSSSRLVCSDRALIASINRSATPALAVRALLLSAPSHPYSNWLAGGTDETDGVFYFACAMDDKVQGVEVVRELHEHIERQPGGGPKLATNSRLATSHIRLFNCLGSRGQYEYVLMFVARHGGRKIIKFEFGLEWEEGERPIIRKKYADEH